MISMMTMKVLTKGGIGITGDISNHPERER